MKAPPLTGSLCSQRGSGYLQRVVVVAILPQDPHSPHSQSEWMPVQRLLTGIDFVRGSGIVSNGLVRALIKVVADTWIWGLLDSVTGVQGIRFWDLE